MKNYTGLIGEYAITHKNHAIGSAQTKADNIEIDLSGLIDIVPLNPRTLRGLKEAEIKKTLDVDDSEPSAGVDLHGHIVDIPSLPFAPIDSSYDHDPFYVDGGGYNKAPLNIRQFKYFSPDYIRACADIAVDGNGKKYNL